MKINLDDPRITAFALGELTGRDAVEMARAVRHDPRVSRAVDEVRQTATLLGDTLSAYGAEMLTATQRDAIRSAGARPVITDIASARNPVWKKASVAALGAAAAVVAGLWFINDGSTTDRPDGMVDAGGTDWNQVDTGVLTAPVVRHAAEFDESARQVSKAASDDTAGFRREIADRIESALIKESEELPVLEVAQWHDPVREPRLRVPLSSGATSWPWVKRYIMEAGQLPPARAVRIEEMINHFTYRQKTGLVHAGVQADMEICETPWNEKTHLLAVHIKALPGAALNGVSVELVSQPDWVDKIRLLGYADASSPNLGVSHIGNPEAISKTHGNYVVYEVSLRDTAEAGDDFLALSLDIGGERLLVNKPRPWENASADLKFASVIAATGMLLSDYPETGALNAETLVQLCDGLSDGNAGAVLSADRIEATKLIKKAAHILSSEN